DEGLRLPAELLARPVRALELPEALPRRAGRALRAEQHDHRRRHDGRGDRVVLDGRLRPGAAALPRPRRLVLADPGDAVRAWTGPADTALLPVPGARLDRHPLPAARAVVLRRRVRHLPARPVLPLDPRGAERRRAR